LEQEATQVEAEPAAVAKPEVEASWELDRKVGKMSISAENPLIIMNPLVWRCVK